MDPNQQPYQPPPQQPQEPQQPQSPYQPAPQLPGYDPKSKVANILTVTQPGEQQVCAIKRHPVGIIFTYAIIVFLLAAVGFLGFGLAPHIVSDSAQSNQIAQVSAIITLVLAAICTVYALIATKVYWGNSWVVTTDSVTQVDQNSLFNRQSSQLSLGNLEDVTAEQHGIFQHLFNYGILKVETAGERSKFVFSYCPNPNFYAQQILQAREQFEQTRRGEDTQRSYRGEGSYSQPNPTEADNYGRDVNINT